MAVLLFSLSTNHDDRTMFEYYEVRFKFTPAPLQLHYGRYVIQHYRPQNRRQL